MLAITLIVKFRLSGQYAGAGLGLWRSWKAPRAFGGPLEGHETDFGCKDLRLQVGIHAFNVRICHIGFLLRSRKNCCLEETVRPQNAVDNR